MSLRSQEPVRVFCVAVALAGLALLGTLIAVTNFDLDGFTRVEFFALAPSVLIGELFPLELPRRSGDGEVTVSVMFSFALLLGVGLLPALAAQLTASVVQDRIARKPWWQTGFNLGQYTLSLSAAALALKLLGGYAAIRAGGFQPFDLLTVLAGAAGYFVVNVVLVTRATTLYTRTPFVRSLRSDLTFVLSVSAVLLCLAPVVITILHFRAILFPLLFVPLVGVYASGGQSVRTATAEHLARHDSLTELPNRRWFMEAVTAALKNPSLQCGGLLLVDLNGFKEVNDTLGHHRGDLVLQAVGPRLASSFRAEDLVARLGGDEFAVFMPGADSSVTESAVRRLQDALHAPVDVDGISIELGASIGLAWYPEHGSDVDTLLQRADVAMYRAKASHRSLEIYRTEDDYHTPERLVLATDLRRALADDQLLLYYQPQVELGAGLPVAAEGLVRWQHPQRGLLGPLDFIEIAERNGLIKDLTHRVLDLGLRDLRTWSEAGRNLSLSLNVSVRNLLDRRFPEELEKLLARHGVDGRALTLELTESSLMVDPEFAKQTLRQLADLGVSVAIDDFGTGYSSLAYLTDLPIGELKIDKSFVRAMSADARNAIVVRSTIELAHNLGLRTVAEGIEDAFTFERLRALGCELAQGFHMSQPLPAAGLIRWWDSHVQHAAIASTPAGNPHNHRPSPERGLMILVVTALALVVSVPLAGGRLSRLADIRVRGMWAVLLAVAIQVAITTVIPGGSHWLHAALHVSSYALDAYFVFVNRKLVGVPVVALGAGLNLLAITINGGVMPASATALRISGIAERAGFDNSAAVAHAHLAFLGDIIPVPGPWPIGNVLSIGDLIIFVGGFIVLHVACGSRVAGLRSRRRSARISRDARGSTAGL